MISGIVVSSQSSGLCDGAGQCIRLYLTSAHTLLILATPYLLALFLLIYWKKVVNFFRGSSPESRQSAPIWLYILFFFSGFPALIYQIVWQRALFTIYGVNVESVTVVVTAFMLGLGLGSLAGGRVSRSRLPLVPVFAAVELCTSAYGLVSLFLFHDASQFTAGSSTLVTGISAFALIVVPTILMGSTLPILLAYLVRRVPNMGRATGILYFVNTLGSATACFAAGEYTMRLLGMSGSVRLAASINALIGVAALVAWARMRSRPSADSAAIPADSNHVRVLSLRAGITLAGLSGFIALGYEIVWYRVFSWESATNPKTFALLLGSYLVGLAAGSLIVEGRCSADRSGEDQLWFAGIMLVGGNILAVLIPPIFSYEMSLGNRSRAELIAMIAVACATAMLGTTFPLACHLTVTPDRAAGEGLSFLYVTNIVGSAAGSFIAGYVLTEFFRLPGLAALFGAAGILLGLLLMLKSDLRRLRPLIVCATAGAIVIAFLHPMYVRVYDRLSLDSAPHPYLELVENRHGVVAVAADNTTVLGGGIYDGRFNVDAINDINGLKRCFGSFGFLARQPKKVLMVGLASGSWAQVVANYPGVESLTIVEINPGYLQLIPDHSSVASLLRNPRVKIVIDDGHRWLLRNPDAKFDSIIMNTTFFWRANATNLLSREFLELVRHHLEPGGIHVYNTTGSNDALYTAVSVFPYAVRIDGLIAVSDSPMEFHAQQWREQMLAEHLDGHPLLDPERAETKQYLDSIVHAAEVAQSGHSDLHSFFEYAPELRARLGKRTVVTDDNMAVEWRGMTP